MCVCVGESEREREEAVAWSNTREDSNPVQARETEKKELRSAE